MPLILTGASHLSNSYRLKTSRYSTVDFQGVLWVTFEDVREPGTISLKVKDGLPAYAEGFNPGWPIASYHIDFTGKAVGPVDISFYVGGISFGGAPSSLRVFQLDGKFYRDITTIIDLPRKVITARTNELSTFVIMSRALVTKETKNAFSVKKK